MKPSLIVLWLGMLAGCAWSAPSFSAGVQAEVRDESGAPVADAIVIAVPQNSALLRRHAGPLTGKVEQIGEEFVPRVSAVRVGSAVSFPNRDPVRHHVYSFSPAKRFELPLYAGTPAEPVVFDKPGVVILGCNIHDWMIGYIYVSETPFFAKTGKDGKVVLEVPPRAYIVRVWHPQLDGSEDATRKKVDAARGRSAEVAWKLPLKPEVRVRRAPLPDRGGAY